MDGLTATAKYKKKVSRTVNDPGIYILEPIADEFETAFNLQSRRRMHRKGWIRMGPEGGDPRGEWLIYQSKGKGTVNLAYDGGAGGIDESTQHQIHEVLRNRPLSSQAEIVVGRDSTDQPFVTVEIPGFVFDDDSRWPELRRSLREAMSEFKAAVDSVPTA